MKINTNVDKITAEIGKNKEYFIQESNSLSSIVDFYKKKQITDNLINYALHASTSYYSSDCIENVFLQIAQDSVKSKLFPCFIYNSVLHVMTESYQGGGHTRVVERWIERSNHTQIHSLVFTSAENHEVPDRLILAVENRSGKITKLSDQLSDLDKGLELRRIASQYEFIILHVHPQDTIPLIAFGNEEFTRPIALFNHADHKFWIGGSISDVIVNFRTWGQQLNIDKRGLDNNFLLTLPIENSICVQTNKMEIKKQLGLSLDMKIIVMVCPPHKLKPIIPEDDFLSVVEALLKDIPDLMFIIIGSFFKELHGWESISKKYNNRIMALGHQPSNTMFKYLNASDLVIDSYPMSGGTALIDAVSCMKPILSLRCPTGQLDYVINSESYCQSTDELVIKAKNILFDENLAQQNITHIQNNINTTMSIEIWNKKINELYENLRKRKHKINYFTSPQSDNISDNDVYLYSEYRRIKYKLTIPFLLSFYTLVKNGKKYREVLLFNKITVRLSEKWIY